MFFVSEKDAVEFKRGSFSVLLLMSKDRWAQSWVSPPVVKTCQALPSHFSPSPHSSSHIPNKWTLRCRGRLGQSFHRRQKEEEGERGCSKMIPSTQPAPQRVWGRAAPSELSPVQAFSYPYRTLGVGCLYEAILTLDKDANCQSGTSACLAAIKKINPWLYRYWGGFRAAGKARGGPWSHETSD